MSHCLNPSCTNPKNPPQTLFCVACGTPLRLKDRYRAIKPIGQGGFGRTFLAVDEDKPSKPPCVIKQFLPQTQKAQSLEKAAQMFEQEAIRLEKLGRHPQIPELMAYFYQDNRQYLVQEFIEGENLAQELAALGAFSEVEICALLKDILPVVQFVHDRKVIHRDIKPENIILRPRDRQLFLVDFGAAKEVSHQGLGRTGTAIGSMGYVAPEQAIGRATYASDLYSLGVTCIHLLTHVHPFDLFDIQEGGWAWRDELTVPVSQSLSQILDKMLATAVSQRYQSANAILQELLAFSSNSSAAPSNLDLELEQLKKKFARRNPSKKTQPLSSPEMTMQNPLDVEIEALRAELFGSNNSQNPPAS